jgi:competence protein ComEA
VDPSLPPSPGSRAVSARERVEDLADRLGTSPAAVVCGVVAVALVLVVGAVVLVGRDPASPPEISIPYAPGADAVASGGRNVAPGGATTATTVPEDLLAHAAGAVARPGVYSLAPGSRVGDLLAAAGGPVGAADVDRLNLAAPLADGTRVYVPVLGEPVPPSVLGPEGATAGDGSDGPVDLNTADASLLEELPGVGPATAAAIVAHREQNGPFQSVDDLLDVRGIGDAKLAALRDLVVV